MSKFLSCLCTALMVALFLAGGESLAITFYTDEQEFRDAFYSFFLTEDFSCSAAEPGDVCSGITPLNSSTNDGCFNACLTPGFEFTAVGVGEYDAIGTGYLGVGIPAVGPKFFTDEARWTFTGALPHAVGFKVIGDLINPVVVDCSFSELGYIVGVATIHGSPQGTFIGAISGVISSIDCVEQVDGSAVFYGGLLFDPHIDGPGPPPPVPATGTWGVIALIGLLLGSLFFMRRGAEV